ncbi:MAG: signal recognition particle protein [Planctomycetota bacterium]|nr:MAG: signal recognition particle protein [Planctomycetota bacterium]
MLENLQQSLSKVLDRFRGPGRLSEEHIQAALRDVRRALLEADVHFQVAKDFTRRVGERLLGQERLAGVSGVQQATAAFQTELAALMASDQPALPKNPRHPMVLLLAGLQGVGKTTAAAKLGLWLTRRRNKRVLLAACDLQRPAAVEQLRQLGERLGLDVHAEMPGPGVDPPGVAARALAQARNGRYDVLVVDTAGRLHVDQELMEEIEQVGRAIRPDASYLVLDGMAGQVAVDAGKAFAERLDLYGVILTKMDGDARGGAALSVREVTGVPVRFLGVGEKPEDLEEFDAERLAGRILDLGDLVGLVEKAQEAVDEQAALDDYVRMMSGRLTMEDLLQQFRMLKKMGSMKKILGMMPGMGKMSGLLDSVDDRQFARIEAIVLSMTPKERLHPELLDGSRRLRVARGSGTSVGEVKRLLRSFQDMQKQMKSLGKMMRGGRSKKRLLRQLGQRGGIPNLPGGFPGL